MGCPTVMRHNPGRASLGDCGAGHDGHARMDRAALVVGEHDWMRVCGPGRLVSEGQAAELAGMGMGMARSVAEKNPAGGNYYQSGWSELHRRYGVTTYRRVAAVKFGEVIWFNTNRAGKLVGVAASGDGGRGVTRPGGDVRMAAAGAGILDRLPPFCGQQGVSRVRGNRREHRRGAGRFGQGIWRTVNGENV